jgi:hypothetical protein
VLDIKLFRENPEIILESEKKRFRDNHFAEKVIEYDTLWREGERKLNSLRQEKNKLSKSFKQAKKDGNFEEVVAKSKAVAAEIKELSAKGEEYKKLRDEELEKRAKNSDSVIAFILEVYRREAEVFHSVNPDFYSDLAKYPQVMKFLETNRKEHRLLFLEIMHKGVDEGYFRSDVNYELVVKLFDSIGVYMSEKELYQDYSFEELFCNMVFVAIRGFCTIKGIEELDKNLH